MLEGATTEDAFSTLLPARVGPLWLVLDAREVQGIVGARAWVPMPHSSPLVPGAIAWRGRAVALFDLAVLGPVALSPPMTEGQERPRTIILSAEGCLVALAVDVVREVQELPQSLLEPSPVPLLACSTIQVPLFGDLAPLLDTRLLVRHVLAASEDATREA